MRTNLKRIVTVLALAGVIGGGYQLVASETHNVQLVEPARAAATTTASNPVALPDFASIVAQYGNAVVNVSVVGKASAASNDDDDDNGLPPLFRRFAPGPQQPRQGLGSGFIVSTDGVILTNAHVVDGAQEVTVRLTDRREFTAKVIGVDKQTDVAVLRIDARDLPVVKLGDARNARVGDWVLAIGSPYGLANTVTAGIVSAKSRALPNETYVPFLQTDVAVNPGNSGGPLFNTAGEVIGINSQIFSRTGGYQGLSFAIPIEVANQVKDQILAHGKVTRGFLGVTVQDVNQGLADSFGMKHPEGALVSDVTAGSPAQKAGLQPGDVIVQVGDDPVNTSTELPAQIARMQPGSHTTLKVWRKGDVRSVDVTLGSLPTDRVALNKTESAAGGKLGLGVRPLSPAERAQVGLTNGLVVEDVDGAAAKAGIQQGDVIVSVNGTLVKSVEQLRDIVAKAGKHVALLVQRDDARIFIPVPLG
ncbi:MAG: DegQ family serine endoprotease [Burkholderiales bacterium]|nr:DegQ family serine endoprotease [Burkholderiales bacterium]